MDWSKLAFENENTEIRCVLNSAEAYTKIRHYVEENSGKDENGVMFYFESLEIMKDWTNRLLCSTRIVMYGGSFSQHPIEKFFDDLKQSGDISGTSILAQPKTMYSSILGFESSYVDNANDFQGFLYQPKKKSAAKTEEWSFLVKRFRIPMEKYTQNSWAQLTRNTLHGDVSSVGAYFSVTVIIAIMNFYVTPSWAMDYEVETLTMHKLPDETFAELIQRIKSGESVSLPETQQARPIRSVRVR